MLEGWNEFSSRKGEIRSRKLHFPNWKKKYWKANKKKRRPKDLLFLLVLYCGIRILGFEPRYPYLQGQFDLEGLEQT
jgi:hypothetical protein